MEGCTEEHSTKSKLVVSGIFVLKIEWIFASTVDREISRSFFFTQEMFTRSIFAAWPCGEN